MISRAIATLVVVAAVGAISLGLVYAQGIIKPSLTIASDSQDSISIGDKIASTPAKNTDVIIAISDSIKSSKQIPLETLKAYALELINKDRAEFGLAPVASSFNEAAQVHADDVFATKRISHWMTNGEKPYMTYSRYDGIGDVTQNVATFADPAYSKDCTSGFFICDIVDPYREIEDLQYLMMYDDAVCCDDGHRYNILDVRHTHVSIGITYDEYAFVIVQNFENNYLELNKLVNTENNFVILNASVLHGTLGSFAVYYDSYPTPRQYEIHRDDNSYGIGELVATIEKPPPPGYYYPPPDDYILIEANSWESDGQDVEIYFDLDRVIDKPGVYTIIGWISGEEEWFTGFSYSVFVES